MCLSVCNGECFILVCECVCVRACLRMHVCVPTCVSGARTETETGKERKRDTQIRRRKGLLPFFAVFVPPCIRVCS